MSHVIAGLGNPGAEYENTRHNIGWAVLEVLSKRMGIGGWTMDKKSSAYLAKGELGGQEVKLVLPATYMNNSGKSLAVHVTSSKKAHGLIVVHDDMDLPLGTLKVSFDRGSGGHRGVESVINHLKTKEFVRVRVGICPTTPGGKLKKPKTEDEVLKFVLGRFRPGDEPAAKEAVGRAAEAVETIVKEGKDKAANRFN